jgi:hypothetical protein
MKEVNVEGFMKRICKYKKHWCNGKHIPEMKKTGKYADGREKFSDEDINTEPDKEPCKYYKSGRCTNERNRQNNTFSIRF